MEGQCLTKFNKAFLRALLKINMKCLLAILSITCSVGAVEKECYFDRVCLEFLNKTEHEIIYRQENNLRDHKYHYLVGQYDAYLDMLMIHQTILECHE